MTATDPYAGLKSSNGRQAKSRRCRTCRAPIIRGLSADSCACEVDVDPTPLTALGEALALLAGRRTATVQRQRQGLTLTIRSPRDVAARPAGSRPAWFGPFDVVPTHQCHAPPLPQAPTRLTPPDLTDLDPDAPPPF